MEINDQDFIKIKKFQKFLQHLQSYKLQLAVLKINLMERRIFQHI